MPHVRAESERLRESFADVLRQQVLEASQLATLLGDDADLREALGEMLDRLRSTALSLQLAEVERAAAEAGAAVRAGRSQGALDPLLALCRALDPTVEELRPVVVIGVAGASPDPLVRVAPTLADAVAATRASAALAVLAPVELLADLPADVFGATPRYGWGAADDLACRLGAARAGAAGYFAAPLDLRTVGERLRARVLSAHEPDRVLLVGAPDDLAGAWTRALHGLPLDLTVLPDRHALLGALAEVDPALVVLADPRADELVAVLRGHPDWWDLPRVVVADVPPEGLVELTLPTDLAPDGLRAQLAALLERARREGALRAAERGTGVLPRAAFLGVLDREVGLARRVRQPLAAARIDVDEPAALRRAQGTLALGAALRLLARALLEVVRATDIVGRVGDHGFGVLLPGATRASVRDRFGEVERRFAALAAADPRLAGVTATAGLADTNGDAEAILHAADRDRLLARRGA